MNSIVNARLKPVSYTHLDVYKRQRYGHYRQHAQAQFVAARERGNLAQVHLACQRSLRQGKSEMAQEIAR